MSLSEKWDWECGKRVISDLDSVKGDYDWIEEPYASPDGERVAAVVRTDGEPFGVSVNGEVWENTFDRAWYLRFSPDGRLTALVSDSGEWTLAVDGEPWENRFEFAWNTQFSRDGKNIYIAAVHSEKRYLVVGNDVPWEEGFFHIGDMVVSPDGLKVGLSAQTVATQERAIARFQEGAFSVAINGVPWESTFLNVWEPAFSSDGSHAAACVRTTLYDYTIVVDGTPWKKLFGAAWAPRFSPADRSVTAPVRVGGKWFLARDGEIFWERGFTQLWNHLYSPDGGRIAAIVAPKFGRWTVAVDGKPWTNTFSDLATDIQFSPDGRKIACIFRDEGSWGVCLEACFQSRRHACGCQGGKGRTLHHRRRRRSHGRMVRTGLGTHLQSGQLEDPGKRDWNGRGQGPILPNRCDDRKETECSPYITL